MVPKIVWRRPPAVRDGQKIVPKMVPGTPKTILGTILRPNMGAALGRPTQRARRPSAAAPFGYHIWLKNGPKNGLWGTWDHFWDDFLTIPDGRGSPPDHFSDHFRSIFWGTFENRLSTIFGTIFSGFLFLHSVATERDASPD